MADSPVFHPFDAALQLLPTANDPHGFDGHTSAAYWNMVGPYGGISAATLVQAVMQHPQRLGEPLVLTVNYAAGTAAGAYRIHAEPVRSTRSTQHWVLRLTQPDADAQDQVVLTATAMTALRRDTWQQSDAPLPQVPAPQAVPRSNLQNAMEWLSRYDLRYHSGSVPSVWDGSLHPSLSQLWMRDEPVRPLDYPALAAMSDVFYPRIWRRRTTRVPAGTVSMTIYFHASARQLTETGTGYLLGQAQAQAFRHGFFDQTAQVWNEAGTLLATSHQLVYFKE
ncbi:MAG: acyl-CoA thioesterase [Burkholderiaceae bacterium]